MRTVLTFEGSYVLEGGSGYVQPFPPGGSALGTTWSEGTNIVVGTTTGSMLGTGATQKLGFWGATPSVRPAAQTATVAAAPAGGTGTAAGGWSTAVNRDAAITLINNLKTRLDALETKLQTIGLLT